MSELKENTENKQLDLAIDNSRNFFNDIDKHFECLKQKEYNKATLKFEKGRKLWLELEVEEAEMTTWLYKWLYNKNEDGSSQIPFGCRLDSIHFVEPANKDLKQKLLDLANSL